jgi:hypothetical protein
MFREALADGQAREMQCGVLQARAAAAEAEVSYFSVTHEQFHSAVTYWLFMRSHASVYNHLNSSLHTRIHRRRMLMS